jgi:mannose/fructose/N-acetylgalactosamine-specific phosphotransferase system component IID
MDMERKNLSSRRLLKLLLRGLLIQSCWNFENFQGIGFAYVLGRSSLPEGAGEEQEKAFYQRHMKCFNTNPYLAGLIVGGVVRLEEEYSAGRATAAQIETYKQDLTGPLGALGDSLTWGTWRPLASLLAVMTALMFESLAPLVFLILYNCVALWIRYTGIRNGYAYGSDILGYLKVLNLQKKIFWMNGFILFVAGALLPLWVVQEVPQASLLFFGICVLMMVLVLAVLKSEKLGRSYLVQIVVLLFFSQVLAHLGWISF